MSEQTREGDRVARSIGPAEARASTACPARRRGLVGALLGALACACGEVRPTEPPQPGRLSSVRSFVCCYRSDLRPEELKGFDLAIVESGVEASPEALRGGEGRRLVVAYLSMGELESGRPGFAGLRKAGVAVEENPSWPGAWRVDPRAPAWRAHILREADRLWRRGFDGLFLDTVDVAGFLEEREPARFRGATDAMVDLVRSLRQRLPDAAIILNQGLDLYPGVRSAIDAALAEDLFTRYDFETKTYGPAPDDDWHRLRLARYTRLAAEGLPVLAIEYVRPKDRSLALRALRATRRRGFLVYLAEIDLQAVRRDALEEAR